MRRYLFLSLTLLVFFSLVSFAQAATYYVSPTGNDSNSGLSDAQAWRSASRVNSVSFATGDDVYFKCGGTWTGQTLDVSWSGTSSNRAVIGAYYMSGSSPVIGVSGNRPVFDGVQSGNAGTVPTRGSWAAMISVNNHPYVTIQDIEIRWSGDRGIGFNGSTYGLVSNCVITNSYGAGNPFRVRVKLRRGPV